MNDTEFELSKMAVTTDVQGRDRKKINGALHKSAKENQIKKLLFIQQRLIPAISLYEKIWFCGSAVR
jgi:hypothetical protein